MHWFLFVTAQFYRAVRVWTIWNTWSVQIGTRIPLAPHDQTFHWLLRKRIWEKWRETLCRLNKGTDDTCAADRHTLRNRAACSCVVWLLLSRRQTQPENTSKHTKSTLATSNLATITTFNWSHSSVHKRTANALFTTQSLNSHSARSVFKTFESQVGPSKNATFQTMTAKRRESLGQITQHCLEKKYPRSTRYAHKFWKQRDLFGAFWPFKRVTGNLFCVVKCVSVTSHEKCAHLKFDQAQVSRSVSSGTKKKKRTCNFLHSGHRCVQTACQMEEFLIHLNNFKEAENLIVSKEISEDRTIWSKQGEIVTLFCILLRSWVSDTSNWVCLLVPSLDLVWSPKQKQTYNKVAKYSVQCWLRLQKQLPQVCETEYLEIFEILSALHLSVSAQECCLA